MILSRNEQIELVKYLLNCRAVIVPYIEYKKPKYIVIDDPCALQRIIDDKELCGPVFVSWQDYQRFPYEFHEVERNNGIRYFLKQRHGGPYINFSPCAMIRKRNKSILTSGSISYYNKYYIEELAQEIVVSDLLKGKYRSIVKYLRKITTCCKAGKRSYWVGKEALKFIEAGGLTSVDNLKIV